MKSKKYKKSDGEFQAEVITHLHYIKETQDRHEKAIGGISIKIDNMMSSSQDRLIDCGKRFGKIEKRMARAEGVAVGIGGIGGVLGFISAVWSWLGLR